MAGEKRTQEREEAALEQDVILVDIEGTTTSISFVKDTLFPYIRENLKKYIDDKWEDEEFKTDLKKLKEQAEKDQEDNVPNVVSINGETVDEEKDALIKNVLWQMDNDRKTVALKQLQGHLWREAYESGAVRGHVYDDVKKAFECWINRGKKIYVYSSGSVEAQKLLFQYSESGDLLKYFSGHFDTQEGLKHEVESYKNIANKINVEPSSVLFLTDIVKEADAAKEAGMNSILVVRDGNASLNEENQIKYTVIKSFLDLTFHTSAKCQKLDNIPAGDKEKLENGNSEISIGNSFAEPMETVDAPLEKLEKKTEILIVDSEENDKMKVEPKLEAKDVHDTETNIDLEEKEEAKVTDESDAKQKPEEKLCEPNKLLDNVTVKDGKGQEIKEKPETKLIECESVEVTKETKKTTVNETKSEELSTLNTEVEQKRVTEFNEKMEIESDIKEPVENNEAKVAEKLIDNAKETEQIGATAVEENKVVGSDVTNTEISKTEVLKPGVTKLEVPVSDADKSEIVNPEIVSSKVAKSEETIAINGNVKVEEEVEKLKVDITKEKCNEIEKVEKDMEKEKPAEIEVTVEKVEQTESKSENKSEAKSEVNPELNQEEVISQTKEDEEDEKMLNGMADKPNTEKETEDCKDKDKPHRNGVEKELAEEENEKKGKITNEETVQNGETPSEDTIKVKKVVDSADESADPEPVVTPVAVAATS